MWEQVEALTRWVAWAEEEVAKWPEDVSQPRESELVAVLREAAASSRRQARG